jgi:hypothetical protein
MPLRIAARAHLNARTRDFYTQLSISVNVNFSLYGIARVGIADFGGNGISAGFLNSGGALYQLKWTTGESELRRQFRRRACLALAKTRTTKHFGSKIKRPGVWTRPLNLELVAGVGFEPTTFGL